LQCIRSLCRCKTACVVLTVLGGAARFARPKIFAHVTCHNLPINCVKNFLVFISSNIRSFNMLELTFSIQCQVQCGHWAKSIIPGLHFWLCSTFGHSHLEMMDTLLYTSCDVDIQKKRKINIQLINIHTNSLSHEYCSKTDVLVKGMLDTTASCRIRCGC
jgi:hypothetical protein